ncbi:MAG: NUDIX hydrolase [Pseudomonadota bacterium]
MAEDFIGAKAAVFIGDKLLVMLRDDIPTIPHPDVWDFPGGGREGDEAPYETLAREVFEEFGLTITEAQVAWRLRRPSTTFPGHISWFFVVHLPAGSETDIVFGDEGQCWELMSEEAFFAHPKHHPPYRALMDQWHAAQAG